MKFLTKLPKAKYTGTVLKLSKYTAALAPVPRKVYWEYKVPLDLWGVLGNDTVGDCEIARIMHIIMLATAHTGTMLKPTVEETLAVYSAVTGYDPKQTQPDGSNPTDNGANTPDVFNYWQNTGIMISGKLNKIAGWVRVRSDIESIKQAIWLFCAASLDIAVYQSMMDQFNGHQPWDAPAGDLLGYHAVPFFGFGSEGTTGVTWGALQQMGWQTALQILQGAYAVITEDWITSTGKSPNGFDLAALQADLDTMKE